VEALSGEPATGQPVDYTPLNFVMTRGVSLYCWDELPLDKVTEMVARKAIVGARQTLAQSYLKAGAIVPLHSHPDEQMIYVLQGTLNVFVDGETVTVGEGHVMLVPAGAPHQAEALEDTFVMTVGGV
jgi:quercetin dioxygenase-like cupin family protein